VSSFLVSCIVVCTLIPSSMFMERCTTGITSAPAEGSIKNGSTLLVQPRSQLSTDPGVVSFTDFVDRALADARNAMITEHIRLLHRGGLAPEMDQKKVATATFPLSSVPQQPQPPSSLESLLLDQKPSDVMNARVGFADCGIQTQVDWAWPEPPLPPWPTVPEEPALAGVRFADVPAEPQFGVTAPQPQISEEAVVSPGSLKPQRRTEVTMSTENMQASRDKKQEEKSQKDEDMHYNLWARLLKEHKKDPLQSLDMVMYLIIIANGIAIAISCDTREWAGGWLIVDSIFAAIFLGELLVRLKYYGFAGYLCRGDAGMANFEMGLVILAIVEVVTTALLSESTLSGSSVFRIVRLVRLVKLLRIARVPMAAELVMMINGTIGGARTLFWALVMVSFPLFVVALVLRETLGEESGTGNGSQSFGSLSAAYFTIFRCVVAGDCSDETGRPIFVLVVSAYGWFYGIVYAFTLVFMQFGLFNVIIAVFVEETVEAAKYNELYQKRLRLNDGIMFQEKSLEMAELAYSLKKNVPVELVASSFQIEEIQSLELSNEEFNDLCKHKEFKELLSALDVAEEDHLDLFDTLDVDGGGSLDLGEIVSGIYKLRGDARKSDIVAVILIARHLNRSLASFMDETGSVLAGQRQQLLSLQKSIQSMAGQRQQLSGQLPKSEPKSESMTI